MSMNEEKKFDEQVKDYIKEVCEIGKYDVNYDEFDIDVTFYVTKHFIKCSYICLHNEWDITYKTKLTEKDGKFYHTIYGSVDPKYIAAYAVIGYVESKKRYYEECEKKKIEEEKEKNKKVFWFKKIFKR